MARRKKSEIFDSGKDALANEILEAVFEVLRQNNVPMGIRLKAEIINHVEERLNSPKASEGAEGPKIVTANAETA